MFAETSLTQQELADHRPTMLSTELPGSVHLIENFSWMNISRSVPIVEQSASEVLTEFLIQCCFVNFVKHLKRVYVFVLLKRPLCATFQLSRNSE